MNILKMKRKVQDTNIDKHDENDEIINITMMPYEMLLHIFSYIVTFEDLFSLFHVCQLFHHFSKEDILWKSLLGEQYLLFISETTSTKHTQKTFKQLYMEWLEQSIKNAKMCYEHDISFYNRFIQSDTNTSFKMITGNHDNADYYIIPSIIIGDRGVGKTSILQSYFSDITDNNDPYTNFPFNEKEVKISVRDVYHQGLVRMDTKYYRR